MAIDRRRFLRTSAAGALGLGLVPDALLHAAPRAPVEPARKPLRLLILGGTGFTGPFQVHYAVARGHEVTVFNRGRRQADLPASVIQLQGDRNDDLTALRGKTWDVVIDNPTTLPFWVRDAASLLKDSANQYVFISTISAYAAHDTPGMDESAPTAPYEGNQDPMTLTMDDLMRDMGLFGPLKALSEQEAEKWFPGRTTVIRPGLIVGPGDQSDRFSYWPLRIRRGGEIVAPGTGRDAIQFIDARDLAEWTIRMVEQNVTGVFNATGPRPTLTMAEMLGGIRGALPGNHEVRLTWIPFDFLSAHGVRAWSHMPVWMAPTPQMAGFGSVSTRRALDAGLTFRPLADTVNATLNWFDAQPEERRNAPLRAGLPPEREAEVLAAWHARGAS
jgi:2'-hydroxyisoflavone reductase